MPTVTTLYRAIVMIVTGVIVVKGWQLYGPSNEQVKAFAVAALEKAQVSWNGSQQNSGNSPTAVADPRSAAPAAMAVVPAAVPLPVGPAPQLVPVVNAGEDTVHGAGETTLAAPAPLGHDLEANAVTTLLARLHELGGGDAHVGPWGSSGGLYRCSCRAKLVETSPLARHFEAVAGEPTAAVEQVVAKVEAWRTEQQENRLH